MRLQAPVGRGWDAGGQQRLLASRHLRRFDVNCVISSKLRLALTFPFSFKSSMGSALTATDLLVLTGNAGLTAEKAAALGVQILCALIMVVCMLS